MAVKRSLNAKFRGATTAASWPHRVPSRAQLILRKNENNGFASGREAPRCIANLRTSRGPFSSVFTDLRLRNVVIIRSCNAGLTHSVRFLLIGCSFRLP